MITITTTIHKPLPIVWEYWTNPQHITQWNFASDDWECPHATNDVRVGGKLSAKMSAKNKSASFVFDATYTKVEHLKTLHSVLADGRKIETTFVEKDGVVQVTEKFDPERENSVDMQRAGWQAILDNFKACVEKAP